MAIQTVLEALPAQKAASSGERTAGKDSRDQAAMAVRLCFDDLRSAARKAFAMDDEADARFRGIVGLMPRATERRGATVAAPAVQVPAVAVQAAQEAQA